MDILVEKYIEVQGIGLNHIPYGPNNTDLKVLLEYADKNFLKFERTNDGWSITTKNGVYSQPNLITTLEQAYQSNT